MYLYAKLSPHASEGTDTVYHTQAINPTMARAKCYHTMDAFVKLVVVLVRYSGDATNTVTKVNLLNKVGTSVL